MRDGRVTRRPTPADPLAGPHLGALGDAVRVPGEVRVVPEGTVRPDQEEAHTTEWVAVELDGPVLDGQQGCSFLAHQILTVVGVITARVARCAPCIGPRCQARNRERREDARVDGAGTPAPAGELAGNLNEAGRGIVAPTGVGVPRDVMVAPRVVASVGRPDPVGAAVRLARGDEPAPAPAVLVPAT